MKRILAITSLLSVFVFLAGCNTTQYQDNTTAGKTTDSNRNWSECALMGGITLGLPGALAGLASGGTAFIAGAVLAGTACATKNKNDFEHPPYLLFSINSYDLTMEGHLVLNKLVEGLEKDSKIELTGHTCSLGSPDFNQTLSEDRATAVQTYLIQKGVDSKNISLTGEGELNPVFSNKTEATRKNNRRVDIVVK